MLVVHMCGKTKIILWKQGTYRFLYLVGRVLVIAMDRRPLMTLLEVPDFDQFLPV